MIIDSQLKFLFIHIQKTGGSSITQHLLSNTSATFFHFPHTLLNQVQLTDEQESYFKFTFVRNPWSRLFSWYSMIMIEERNSIFYDYIRKNAPSFSAFLHCIDIIDDTVPEPFESVVPNIKCIAFNQLDYITKPDGKLGTDFIGRFEHLGEDFKYICDKMNIPNRPLPRLKQFTQGDYRKAYTNNDIEKVYSMYKKDIEYFKYTF
ncbi:MAG: sulfotransferase family protein [Saprospiraceae bacterium]|jgi:hypothetical protein|nr:sulfotransferase family protein [Saprospiraceae bacterium]